MPRRHHQLLPDVTGSTHPYADPSPVTVMVNRLSRSSTEGIASDSLHQNRIICYNEIKSATDSSTCPSVNRDIIRLELPHFRICRFVGLLQSHLQPELLPIDSSTWRRISAYSRQEYTNMSYGDNRTRFLSMASSYVSSEYIKKKGVCNLRLLIHRVLQTPSRVPGVLGNAHQGRPFEDDPDQVFLLRDRT